MKSIPVSFNLPLALCGAVLLLAVAVLALRTARDPSPRDIPEPREPLRETNVRRQEFPRNKGIAARRLARGREQRSHIATEVGELADLLELDDGEVSEIRRELEQDAEAVAELAIRPRDTD